MHRRAALVLLGSLLLTAPLAAEEADSCPVEIDGTLMLRADGPALGIGGPWADEHGLYNAYFICSKGRVISRVLKHHLPNDTVFDEVRIYDSGPIGGPYSVGNTRIGSPICEDAWYPDVAETLAETGAEFLLVPNGSPYFRNKLEVRQNHMVARVIEGGAPLAYLNAAGAQDELVFDGGSFALDQGGALAAQALLGKPGSGARTRRSLLPKRPISTVPVRWPRAFTPSTATWAPAGARTIRKTTYAMPAST